MGIYVKKGRIGRASTGPTTGKGKARSSRNATTHGMTSSSCDETLVEGHLDAVEEHFGEGRVPRNLVILLALAQERVTRVRSATGGTPEDCVDHLIGPSDAQAVDESATRKRRRRSLHDRYLTEALSERRRALNAILHHLSPRDGVGGAS